MEAVQQLKSPDAVVPSGKAMLWAGRVVSALPTLMLAMSAFMKLSHNPKMMEGMPAMGWDPKLLTALGIVELTSALLYAIPRTATLGAILCVGYLGGAVATHVRIGQPFVIPLVLGILVWAGLYLRDARVRALLPLR